MRLSFVPVLPLVLLACGDNGDQMQPPDAHRPDTMVDAPGATCEYTEAMDADNDAFFGTSNGEATGLTFGTTKQTICGKLNNSHYDAGKMLVDVDSYIVNVTTATSTLIQVTAPGAENLNTVLVEIDNNTTGAFEVGSFLGNHAAASLDLPPGDYLVTISSFHSAAATADISYRLTLNPDNPTTRCPKSTATATYTEANDLVTADGNDVYEVRYGATNTPHRAFTASVVDNPETVSTAIAPNMSYRITGTLSTPTVTPADWADSFQERDTYSITTGANTNQLTMRLNWPGTTADLDVLVFPATGLNDFADGYDNRLMEDEFTTFAVEPNKIYWFFVGGDDTSTLPVTYDLTLCGATFTP